MQQEWLLMSSTPRHTYLRSHEIVRDGSCEVVVLDLQEKLLPGIFGRDSLLSTMEMLLQAARICGVPMRATEQAPEKLGGTAEPLRSLLPTPLSKVRFSAGEVLDMPPASTAAEDRFQIVLCGIETHICVLQTALDLLALGYQVFVPYDATASRDSRDHDWGLRRLENCGAMIVSAESILFEWTATAVDPRFREISGLVKQRKR